MRILNSYNNHMRSAWQTVFLNCNEVKHHNYSDSCFELCPTPTNIHLTQWRTSGQHIKSSVEHKPWILIESFFIVKSCSQTESCFHFALIFFFSWVYFQISRRNDRFKLAVRTLCLFSVELCHHVNALFIFWYRQCVCVFMFGLRVWMVVVMWLEQLQGAEVRAQWGATQTVRKDSCRVWGDKL